MKLLQILIVYLVYWSVRAAKRLLYDFFNFSCVDLAEDSLAWLSPNSLWLK